MIVKFFASKNGGGTASIDYLLDKKRTKEGTARILKGNESLTRELIKSMKQKHKACVGCLSFEETNIDENLKQELMESFENMLLTPEMAGRYNILWVEHRDKNRLELNFVIPKIDLESKKAFNPYFDMADRKRKDLWTDSVNFTHNFSNPKDPSKTQSLQGSKKERELFKDYEELDKWLHEQVKQGEITSRADILSLIKANNCEVTREGKDYIGIKLPNSTKAKRFKGGIYDEQFTGITGLEKLIDEQSQRERDYNQRDNESLLRDINQQLNERIQAKVRFYAEQHKRGTRESTSENLQHESAVDKDQDFIFGVSMRDANDAYNKLDSVFYENQPLSSIQKEHDREQKRSNLYDLSKREYANDQRQQGSNPNQITQRSEYDSIRGRIDSRNRAFANKERGIAEAHRAIATAISANDSARERISKQRERIFNDYRATIQANPIDEESLQRQSKATTSLTNAPNAEQERVRQVREKLRGDFSKYHAEFTKQINAYFDKLRERIKEFKERLTRQTTIQKHNPQREKKQNRGFSR